MYQIVYKYEGKTEHRNYDTAKEAEGDYKFYNSAGWEPVVYHKSSPTKPSEVPLPEQGGYYRDIKQGEREIYSSRIVCDRFTITFSRTASAAIDDFCDALNGWYTRWSDEVTIVMTTKSAKWVQHKPLIEADKLFEEMLEESKHVYSDEE